MRVLVLGAARSGLAAARLAARLGYRVSVYDANPKTAAEVLSNGVAALVGAWDPSYLDGVDLVIASPGLPERSEPITDAYEAGVPVESEVEFGWKQLDVESTVAVTGTNGKTTVTAMIADMLNHADIAATAMGNIGLPVCDCVGNEMDAAVIEVSSAQLQLCRTFRPEVAVVTNVTEDHLDWHGSMAAYRTAKAGVVLRQTGDDVVVFDGDDVGATEVASRSAGRQIGVGSASPDFHHDGSVATISGVEVERSDLAGPFLTDLLLASAASLNAGASLDAVTTVAAGFQPDDHRQRVVATVNSVLYVNDSKATNPEAAIAAIDSYDSVILIAGGQAKGLDIAKLVRRPSVRAVMAMGESAQMLAAASPDRVTVVQTMDEAVRLAVDISRPGDVVLLSPGGASWDMFTSYIERGAKFAAAVAELTGGDQ